jgi:N-acetylglucosamine-6-phosphate deacetylase
MFRKILLGMTSFCLGLSASEPTPFTHIKKFTNARLLLNHQIREGELWVAEGKIIPPQPKADSVIDAGGKILAPGFIDLQINGGFGCDFSRNPEKIDVVAKELLQYGVTAFLPTVISSTPSQYRSVLPHLQPRTFGKEGAAVLGIHLEGPFFSAAYAGAHHPGMIVSSFEEPIEAVYGDLQGVKLVTLAPELPGGLHLIRLLKDRGIVVSAGHSAASLEQMQAGIEAGIELVTHLFTRMSSFHHRHAGIIGAALLNPSIPYSLIVDGVHLSPETVLLSWRCNPDGLFLISDAMEALGMPPGQYKLGTLDVEIHGDQIYLSGTQTLAGSVLRMDRAVRNLHAMTKCSKAEALEAASLKPAKLIHAYPQKGTLEVGADADFIILSDELEVESTYLGGELSWQRNS